MDFKKIKHGKRDERSKKTLQLSGKTLKQRKEHEMKKAVYASKRTHRKLKSSANVISIVTAMSGRQNTPPLSPVSTGRRPSLPPAAGDSNSEQQIMDSSIESFENRHGRRRGLVKGKRRASLLDDFPGRSDQGVNELESIEMMDLPASAAEQEVGDGGHSYHGSPQQSSHLRDPAVLQSEPAANMDEKGEAGHSASQSRAGKKDLKKKKTKKRRKKKAKGSGSSPKRKGRSHSPRRRRKPKPSGDKGGAQKGSAFVVACRSVSPKRKQQRAGQEAADTLSASKLFGVFTSEFQSKEEPKELPKKKSTKPRRPETSKRSRVDDAEEDPPQHNGDIIESREKRVLGKARGKPPRKGGLDDNKQGRAETHGSSSNNSQGSGSISSISSSNHSKKKIRGQENGFLESGFGDLESYCFVLGTPLTLGSSAASTDGGDDDEYARQLQAVAREELQRMASQRSLGSAGSKQSQNTAATSDAAEAGGGAGLTVPQSNDEFGQTTTPADSHDEEGTKTKKFRRQRQPRQARKQREQQQQQQQQQQSQAQPPFLGDYNPEEESSSTEGAHEFSDDCARRWKVIKINKHGLHQKRYIVLDTKSRRLRNVTITNRCKTEFRLGMIKNVRYESDIDVRAETSCIIQLNFESDRKPYVLRFESPLDLQEFLRVLGDAMERDVASDAKNELTSRTGSGDPYTFRVVKTNKYGLQQDRLLRWDALRNKLLNLDLETNVHTEFPLLSLDALTVIPASHADRKSGGGPPSSSIEICFTDHRPYHIEFVYSHHLARFCKLFEFFTGIEAVKQGSKVSSFSLDHSSERHTLEEDNSSCGSRSRSPSPGRRWTVINESELLAATGTNSIRPELEAKLSNPEGTNTPHSKDAKLAGGQKPPNSSAIASSPSKSSSIGTRKRVVSMQTGPTRARTAQKMSSLQRTALDKKLLDLRDVVSESKLPRSLNELESAIRKKHKVHTFLADKILRLGNRVKRRIVVDCNDGVMRNFDQEELKKEHPLETIVSVCKDVDSETGANTIKVDFLQDQRPYTLVFSKKEDSRAFVRIFREIILRRRKHVFEADKLNQYGVPQTRMFVIDLDQATMTTMESSHVVKKVRKLKDIANVFLMEKNEVQISFLSSRPYTIVFDSPDVARAFCKAFERIFANPAYRQIVDRHSMLKVQFSKRDLLLLNDSETNPSDLGVKPKPWIGKMVHQDSCSSLAVQGVRGKGEGSVDSSYSLPTQRQLSMVVEDNENDDKTRDRRNDQAAGDGLKSGQAKYDAKKKENRGGGGSIVEFDVEKVNKYGMLQRRKFVFDFEAYRLQNYQVVGEDELRLKTMFRFWDLDSINLLHTYISSGKLEAEIKFKDGKLYRIQLSSRREAIQFLNTFDIAKRKEKERVAEQATQATQATSATVSRLLGVGTALAPKTSKRVQKKDASGKSISNSSQSLSRKGREKRQGGKEPRGTREDSDDEGREMKKEKMRLAL
eukprot:jgi/Bigna1/77453/fgenesh1_pg.48_\